MDDWEPNAEDEYLLKREPNNMNDSNAVAVVQAAKEKTDMPDQATGDGCQANITPEQLDRPI